MTELVQRPSVRATIVDMAVGDVIGLACDVISANTLRHYTSLLGFELNRKYSVHINRENRTYEVTRHE